MNIPPLCFVRFARPAPIIQRGIFWYSVYRHLRLLVSPALLGDLECFIKSIELTLENETNRNIQIIAEGHLDLVHKLDDALKVENEKEMLLLRVNHLENELRKVKERINQIA